MTHIRKPTQADIPAVAAIYDHILTEEEAGRATIGWIRGVYPTRQTAQDALDAGDLFVLEADGVVAAAAKINQIQVPECAGRGDHGSAHPGGGPVPGREGVWQRLCPVL